MRKVVAGAAIAGASVWATYAITESLATLMFIYLRQIAPMLLPGRVPPATADLRMNAAFTAFALLALPLIGGVVNALIALTRFGRKKDATFWSAVAGVIVAVVVGAYGIATAQFFVLPAVAVAIALSALRRPTSAMLVLVGGTMAAEPRALLSVTGRAVAGVVCIATIIVAVHLVERLRPSRPIDARRRWITYAVAGAIVVLATVVPPRFDAAPSAREQTASRARRGGPNVILITLDSVRADHLSLYGYARNTTPFLRRMSADATLYTSAISCSNHTLASHASIFTGAPPSLNGAHRFFRDARTVYLHGIGAHQTMAERLSEDGYRTGAFVANTAYLLPVFGFDRGFGIYDCEFADFFFISRGRPYLLQSLLLRAVAEIVAPQRSAAAFLDARDINAKALRFVNDPTAKGRPFFLFLNYMDAHSPYLPPAPYDTLYPERDPSFRWRNYTGMAEDVVWKRHRLAARTVRHLTSQYDGAITYVDSRLAELFDTLRAEGVLDNTLVIITADHGEAFGEGFVLGHGFSLYQHQIHVPLLVKFPHQHHAATVTDPVSALDILPTVMEVAGAPLQNMRGVSLLRLRSASRRLIASETYHPRELGPNPDEGMPTEFAFVAGSLKEIIPSRRPTELYDLSLDPHETDNLYGRRGFDPDLQDDIARFLAGARAAQPSLGVTDQEVLKRLRSLGYLR